MKRLFYFLSAFALLSVAASCNKTSDAEGPAVEASKPIRVVVGVESGSQTKATGITSNSESTEAKVNSLQVFIFHGEEKDGYAGPVAGKTLAVTCTAGMRDIYAVVNGPNLSNVTTKSAFLATVSNLANEITNFQMIGYKSEDLQEGGSVTVNVDRFAARVVIKGIKNALTNSSQANNFRIVSVYLTNVAGDINFGRDANYAVSTWYNKRGYQAANNLGDFTYDVVNAGVSAGATNSAAHYFYAYPNANAEAVGGPWTPRASRLVVKCSINGVVYNYPILLPALESNKSYEIELLTITRTGNPDDGNEPNDDNDIDEEEPIEGLEKNFEIVVNPWTTVLINGDGNVTI